MCWACLRFKLTLHGAEHSEFQVRRDCYHLHGGDPSKRCPGLSYLQLCPCTENDNLYLVWVLPSRNIYQCKISVRSPTKNVFGYLGYITLVHVQSSLPVCQIKSTCLSLPPKTCTRSQLIYTPSTCLRGKSAYECRFTTIYLLAIVHSMWHDINVYCKHLVHIYSIIHTRYARCCQWRQLS